MAPSLPQSGRPSPLRAAPAGGLPRRACEEPRTAAGASPAVARFDAALELPGCPLARPYPLQPTPGASAITLFSLNPGPDSAAAAAWTADVAGRSVAPAVVCGAAGCAATAAVTGVVAVRSGPDVVLSWDPPAGVPEANVWTVEEPALIGEAREGGSPAPAGVAGCSPPAPAAGASCTDRDALARAPGLLFYQVRAMCGPGREGP